jgi:hypothetical protein
MKDKWFNLPDNYVFAGMSISHSCYICNKILGTKQNKEHYFHNRCYTLLEYIITDKVCIKEISKIIIRLIR